MQHYIYTYVCISKKFADVITETTFNNRGNLFPKLNFWKTNTVKLLSALRRIRDLFRKYYTSKVIFLVVILSPSYLLL